MARARGGRGRRLQRVGAPSGLGEVLDAVQSRHVLPHCARCRKPCCSLESLVLEFDWRRLRVLWGLEVSQAAFDRALARGEGPAEIRTRDGLYYVHKRPCPAYQEGRCAVYDTSLKPLGCSDFPLYLEDDGRVLADLRCEALNLDVLEQAIRARLPSGTRLQRSRDPEFPFLVSYRFARPPPGPARKHTRRR